ncbi:putative orfan [Tupanvirus soda lake]|uniref:Orfan n=2 Tax=Tupanvirus TaxID=2094720 RepID=A0AC62AAX3_9VIRU|nr:putative orfan [Tupanvirus soda lake]QKU34901.1 putative orfan [Tupanvirus soda lake]
MANFDCIEFLQEFIGKSIIDMLYLFDRINMKNDISYQIMCNSEVHKNVVKILNMYMLMPLSKVFYLIDIAIKSNTLDVLPNIYENYDFNSSDDAYKEINSAIAQNLNENDIVSIINDPKSQITKNIMANPIQNLNKIAEAILKIYKYKNKLYNFFINKTSEDLQEICKKYPDLDALIGYIFVTKRIYKKSFIINNFLLKLDNFILVHILGDNIDPFGNEKEQIKNLKMHTGKITNSKIIIEV